MDRTVRTYTQEVKEKLNTVDAKTLEKKVSRVFCSQRSLKISLNKATSSREFVAYRRHTSQCIAYVRSVYLAFAV